jgi:hypothetical protein
LQNFRTTLIFLIEKITFLLAFYNPTKKTELANCSLVVKLKVSPARNEQKLVHTCIFHIATYTNIPFVESVFLFLNILYIYFCFYLKVCMCIQVQKSVWLHTHAVYTHAHTHIGNILTHTFLFLIPMHPPPNTQVTYIWERNQAPGDSIGFKLAYSHSLIGRLSLSFSFSRTYTNILSL